jgi:hypothetical protein
VPGLVPSLYGAAPGSATTRLTIPYVVPASGGSGFETTLSFVSLGNAPAQVTVRLRQPNPESGYPTAPDRLLTMSDMVVEGPLEALFPELASFPKDPLGYYSLEITATSGTLAAHAVIINSATGVGKLILAQPLGPPR